jgi:hypothetical protein
MAFRSFSILLFAAAACHADNADPIFDPEDPCVGCALGCMRGIGDDENLLPHCDSHASEWDPLTAFEPGDDAWSQCGQIGDTVCYNEEGVNVEASTSLSLDDFVDAMFAIGVILAVPSAVFAFVGWIYCCRSSCCPPTLSQRWSQRTVMWLNLTLGLVVFCCLLTSWIVDNQIRCPFQHHNGCGEDAAGGKVYDGDIFSVGAYGSGIACFIAIVSISTGCCMCGPPVARVFVVPV